MWVLGALLIVFFHFLTWSLFIYSRSHSSTLLIRNSNIVIDLSFPYADNYMYTYKHINIFTSQAFDQNFNKILLFYVVFHLTIFFVRISKLIKSRLIFSLLALEFTMRTTTTTCPCFFHIDIYRTN